MHKKINVVMVFIFIIIPTGLLFTYSSTPPNGYTNAPGENNCTSCHSSYSLVTSGQKWDSISLLQKSPYGNGTIASPYSFTLNFKDKNRYKYGFQICVLPINASIGTFSLGTLAVSPLSAGETQVAIAPDRQYIEHNSAGVYTNTYSKSWTFNWIPPVSGYTGNVKFYVCVNSTDDDSYTGGDSVYAKVFTFQVLPVSWLDIKTNYSLNDSKVKLNWSTSTEQNNNRFEIEYSLENEFPFSWHHAGIVRGSNNSNIIKRYFFEHSISNINSNLIYYRIKQIDNDGRFSYSKILSVKINAETDIDMYPNPCHDKIYFKNIDIGSSIKIYKLDGTQIMQTSLGVDNCINLNEIKSGIYQLIIDNEKSQCRKLLVVE
jgi:hypothetical protein